MDNYEQQFKEEVFMQLVEYKITPFKGTDKYKRSFDAQIYIKHNGLRKAVERYAVKVPVSKSEFVSDVVTYIYDLIMNKFNPEQCTWEELAEGECRHAFNSLISYLKGKIKYFAMENYRTGYRTSTKVTLPDGKKEKVHVVVNAEISSIQALILNPKTGDSTAIEDILTESYWSGEKDSEFKLNIFAQWYTDNYKRILTESQIQFLEELSKFNYSKENKQTKLIRQYSNIDTRKIASKLKRIEARVEKYWQKEKQFFQFTFCEQILTRRIELLQMFLGIIEDDSCLNGMGTKLSEFIRANCDANVFENIFDKLNIEDYKVVAKSIQNKAIIPNRILYKISALAEAEIQRLEECLLNERLVKESVLKDKGINKSLKYADFYDGRSTIYLTLTSSGSYTQE